LRFLATRRFPDEVRKDPDDGVPRLVLSRPGWDEYVDLAFQELRAFGKDSPQTVAHLGRVLDDLVTVVPPHRQQALRRHRQALDPDMAPLPSG